MKLKFLLAILCLLTIAEAQSQCPINTVSTNPDNYQNSSDPSGTLMFDWRLQQWTGYRPGSPSPVSLSFLGRRYVSLSFLGRR